MRIPRPTRAECAALLKEMRMRRIGDDATVPRVTTGYLALLDENEALAKALELCQSTCHLKHDAAVATQAALAEYAKSKQEREGM